MKLVVIKYNAGNTQSVVNAVEKLGIEPVLTANPEEILAADKVIFPGVGHASSAMKDLQLAGLDRVLKSLKQPTLGICLGMQLMCARSEEGNTDCLGIFDDEVKMFNPSLGKVPHMGWNNIAFGDAKLFKGLEQNAYFYHVHSYYVPISKSGIASTNYQIEFSSALQKDNFYAVQFHPEKSAEAGSVLLNNFLEL